SRFSGSKIPPGRHSAAAHSRPAAGLTRSLPANMVGSLRIAVARIQATGPGAAAAASGEPITTAHAPSEDGHVSSYRTGSHSMGRPAPTPARYRAAAGGRAG